MMTTDKMSISRVAVTITIRYRLNDVAVVHHGRLENFRFCEVMDDVVMTSSQA
jgi:hypothetical protein